MPVPRDKAGPPFWPGAWCRSSLGLETDQLPACLAEASARGPTGVFARPLPSFQKTDLTCLTDLPQLKCLQLSDIRLPDLTALHRVAPLTRLRLSGKRPAIDCERLPAVQMW